jgi:anti-anti-sigma regulatory factor
MTVIDDATIDSVEVLRLREGDTLIVHVPGRLDTQTAQTIEDFVRSHSQITVDIPVLVLGDGITVSVARPDAVDD